MCASELALSLPHVVILWILSSFIYCACLCYLVLCFPPQRHKKNEFHSIFLLLFFSSLAVCHGEHRSYSEGLDNEHTRSHSNIVFNWRQPATSSLYVVPVCCVWQCACVCVFRFSLEYGITLIDKCNRWLPPSWFLQMSHEFVMLGSL